MIAKARRQRQRALPIHLDDGSVHERNRRRRGTDRRRCEKAEQGERQN